MLPVAWINVYRFLTTSKWLGFATLMVALAAIMVGLGLWQLDRYHQRSSYNNRISAAANATPVPVAQVLTAGKPPPPDASWRKVTITGVYDPAHEILARARTVNSKVGFEVLDPLKLPDGSAVLVDRGWIPAGPSGTALTLPTVPPTPTGQVTVTGRVHLPESDPSQPTRDHGVLEVRRISPATLGPQLPYPLLGAYVLVDGQTPVANSPAFTGIPADLQDSTMNAGYTVQWWAFALITLAAFVWAARREARGPDDEDDDLASLDDPYPEVPVLPSGSPSGSPPG